MTKYQLFALLVSDSPKLVTICEVTGYLLSIEREDGSGSSFNVTLACFTTNFGFKRTVHVRTID